MFKWMPVILTAVGLAVTAWQARDNARSRKKKDASDRGQGLVSTAMSLVKARNEEVEELEEDVEQLTLLLGEANHEVTLARSISKLRSEIETAERERLVQQNHGLRVYCMEVIGLLDVEPPELPDALQEQISILIVNKDAEMLTQIKALLPLYPSEIRVATSIEDAQALLMTVHFDVVIVNWNIPTNGARIYKTIRESGGHKKVVTILVTGDVTGLTTYVPVELDTALETILSQRSKA